MVVFLILSFREILEDLLRASISVASIRLLLLSVSLHVSAPYNKLLLFAFIQSKNRKLISRIWRD
jgi:hypothetical protein